MPAIPKLKWGLVKEPTLQAKLLYLSLASLYGLDRTFKVKLTDLSEQIDLPYQALARCVRQLASAGVLERDGSELTLRALPEHCYVKTPAPQAGPTKPAAGAGTSRVSGVDVAKCGRELARLLDEDRRDCSRRVCTVAMRLAEGPPSKVARKLLVEWTAKIRAAVVYWHRQGIPLKALFDDNCRQACKKFGVSLERVVRYGQG